jgi:transposase-like protein
MRKGVRALARYCSGKYVIKYLERIGYNLGERNSRKGWVVKSSLGILRRVATHHSMIENKRMGKIPLTLTEMISRYIPDEPRKNISKRIHMEKNNSVLKIEKELKSAVLSVLSNNGGNVRKACREIGIYYGRHYQWLKSDSSYKSAARRIQKRKRNKQEARTLYNKLMRNTQLLENLSSMTMNMACQTLLEVAATLKRTRKV